MLRPEWLRIAEIDGMHHGVHVFQDQQRFAECASTREMIDSCRTLMAQLLRVAFCVDYQFSRLRTD